MKEMDNPLLEQPPLQIPLPKAPLVRVLARVNFSAILAIEKREMISQFQEEIRDTYPSLETLKTHSFALGDQGIEESGTQLIWKFIDTQDTWSVSLSSDFLVLETTAYISRQDFIERLEKVLKVLHKYFNPRVVERFGMRYIDRLTGEELKDLSKLVRSEMTGIINTAIKDNISHTLSESVFEIPNTDDKLAARWGLMPINKTFDPAVLEPVDEQSWILDLDMSLTQKRDFNLQELVDEAHRFAERIYTFFRWSITDEFLRRFGGKI